MIKKLFLLSAIASVTACQSYSEKSQCDPEKNYIISDPVAMEEYKKLRASGEVNSYYSERSPVKPCLTAKCVSYDPKNFDFIERNFSDNERKGIYTIEVTTNLSDSSCIKKNPMTSSINIKYCYKVNKNDNNKIKSRYKFLIDNSQEKTIVINFIDLKENKKLYEYSYQLYSTGAIGGLGIGTCPANKINNPNYKFNPYSFHNEKY